MKLLKSLILVLAVNSSFVYATGDDKKIKTTPRNTFLGSVMTNVNEAIPLIFYALLAVPAGANLDPANQEKLIKIPGTDAIVHWIWPSLLFSSTTYVRLSLVESDERLSVLFDTAVNLAFVCGLGGIAYTWGLPVAIGAAGGFVGVAILRSGDNSPIAYIRG